MDSDNKPKLKNIETFTDDMVRVLEHEKGGLIKKIIHEEEERDLQKKNLSPESTKNKIFMLIGLFLIIGATGAVFASVFLKENVFTAIVDTQFTPIIFTDKTTFLEIDNLPTKNEVATLFYNQISNTDVKIGGMEGVYFSEGKNVLSSRMFLEKINSSYPLEGINVLKTGFLMGVFKTKENTKHPFILLKARSFTDVFPKMLIWEKSLFADMSNFFGTEITNENIYLTVKPFEDKFIVNKNARILYDKDGNIAMMYVFSSNDSVVITDNIDTAREIILRLLSGKIKK
ncbi:MAG: hypothetical protein K9L98_01545 [Candidatus Pacebacteria bacterium]|nr:hypothetical protein [Candidatus Paceibacterota bacterium]MCF7862677.1 hypothetical protein [Candidatus Paceibacterota bacterium]